MLRDDAYEEEDDGPLRSHRLHRSPAVSIRQEKAKSTNRVTDAAGRQSVALLLLEMDEQWRNGVINRLFAESFPNAVDAQAEHFRQDLNSQWALAPASDCEGSPSVSERGAGTEFSSPPTDPRSEQCAQNYSWPVRSAANDRVVAAAGVPSKLPTVWTDAPASASYAASLLRLTDVNFAPPESQDIAADCWSSSSPGGPLAWVNEYGLEEHREKEASDHIRAAIDAHTWLDYVDFDAPQNSLDGPGMMTSTGTC